MKRTQQAAKRHILGRYLLLIALSLFFVLLFFKLISGSIWDGRRRFTIVVERGSFVALFSLAPQEAQAIYMNLSGNTLLDVPYGYKTYPTSSIYRLGELEKVGYGGMLLAKSIESTLGVAVDGYWISPEQSFFPLPQNEQELKEVKGAYFTLIKGMLFLPRWLASFRQVNTNLSFIDSWRLWNAVRKIRVDQIDLYNLSQDQALQPEFLADGTSVMKVNKELFDAGTREDFQDTAIRSENITLEVVNATGTERIAAEFSRILEHMGGNVILKTTAKDKENLNCLLYFSSNKHAKATIILRLTQLYKCGKKDIPIVEDNLADIKIVLGEGFIK